MGMNEVASSRLPMLETVIQGNETVAGSRSLIWVWSVARLNVSENFRDDVERREGCLMEIQRSRCERRDGRKKERCTENAPYAGERTDRRLRGLEAPVLGAEVDPLLT